MDDAKMSAEKTVDVTSIEELKTCIAAQARVAVYEAVIKCVITQSQEFDSVEDFASALVAAMLENADGDIAILKERM